MNVAPPHKEKITSAVRLRTTSWKDARGIYQRRDITALKKQSSHHLFWLEDADNIGADLLFATIVNLHECKDGIYELVTCNESKDWETGYVDDYDYRLIPVKPTP